MLRVRSNSPEHLDTILSVAGTDSKPRLQRWLGSSWLHPLNDLDTFDELIEPLGRRWALTRLLASVESIDDETADTKTFWLRPNWRWPGFRAGQHLPVSVEIDGRRHWRSYSLSSAPADRKRVAITVKRQPQGKVSNVLHERLRPGAILRLAPPDGEFALPEPRPSKLLMISAGSGITPMRAMLHALRREAYDGDIAFVHVCRGPEHRIFGDELARWSETWPALRLISHDSTAQGRPDPLSLLDAVPDHRDRHLLLCGPEALMQPLRAHWTALGLDDRLSWERYGFYFDPKGEADSAEVHCLSSGKTFTASTGQPLLFEAERAGLSPDHGCRRGICHSCRYRKKSGIVHNLITGQTSSEPDEMIQLCVCTARSELLLEDL